MPDSIQIQPIGYEENTFQATELNENSAGILENNLSNCESDDLIQAVDRITLAVQSHGQNFEITDLLNEAFYLGFVLVIFSGLLALPIVTIIRVLRG